MRSLSFTACKAFICVSLLTSVGCGKSYPLAPVSGRIEVDHKPLAHAEVMFSPLSGVDHPISMGKTDEKGEFTLSLNNASHSQGAIVGEHRVSISVDIRNLDKKAVVTHMRRLEQLPARYNSQSELRFTVPAGGTTEANFLDLKSK